MAGREVDGLISESYGRLRLLSCQMTKHVYQLTVTNEALGIFNTLEVFF